LGLNWIDAIDREIASAAVRSIKRLGRVNLSKHRVVGNYVRHDKKTRKRLRHLMQRIIEGLQLPNGQESYLIWGPPGSGKSFFPRELARHLGDFVCYIELNMSEPDKTLKEKRFREALEKLRKEDAKPVLFFIDEIDSKPTPRLQGSESMSIQEDLYSYQTWLTQLEPEIPRRFRSCFIFTGSTGSGIKEMRKLMISYDEKAKDLLDRIPPWNRETIPLMSMEDRVVIMLSNLVAEARKRHLKVREVDKLGLLYVALTPDLSSARNVEAKAVYVINRLHGAEDQIQYRYFFTNDKEMIQFGKKWDNQNLLDQYVKIVEDSDLEDLVFPLGPFVPIAQKIKENRKFPMKDDFDRGLVYFDKEESEEIEEVLQSESGRCCLLAGPPSFRKSTFAIYFGLYRKGKGDLVFYGEVEKDAEWAELAKRVKPYDREDVLFIVDQCENSPDTIGRFVDKIKTMTRKARFLFVSTEISNHQFNDQRYNYFERLEPRTAWKNPKQSFEGVIRQFCFSNNIGEERIGDVGRILEICNCIFSVLGYLLKEIWRPEKEILATIPRERIYKKITDDFLTPNRKAEILTKLATLSQFDGVPITPDGLIALNIDPRSEIFQEIEGRGIVQRMTTKLTGKVFFEMCYDSAFAKLILETSDQTGLMKVLFPQFVSLEEFILAMLKNYLCKTKKHSIHLLSAIWDNGMEQIGKELINEDEVTSALRDYFVLERNPQLLWKFLTILRKFKTRPSVERAMVSKFREVALPDWTKGIVEKSEVVESPRRVSVVLALLRKFKIKEDDKIIVLSKFPDDILKKWTSSVLEKRSIHAFFFLLKELRTFDSEKALAFLEIMEPKELAGVFMQWMHERATPKNISSLTGVVLHSGRISKDFSSDFLDQFTEKDLLELLEGSKRQIEQGKCNQIYDFVRRCRFSKTAQLAYRRFLDRHSKELYTFLNTMDLVHAGMMIQVSYWHPAIQNAYSQFVRYDLSEKLFEATLEEITRFITLMSRIRFRRGWVGKHLANEILTLLRDRKPLGLELMDEKLDEGSLEAIQNMINLAIELEANNFVTYVRRRLNDDSRFDLREKFRRSDLGNLGFFIWNIAADPSLSNKCNELAIGLGSELIEKARESGLYDIAIFLLSLHMNGCQCQEIFEAILTEALSREFFEPGEKLALMGLCQFVRPDLMERREFYQTESSIPVFGPMSEAWLASRSRKWLDQWRKGYLRKGVPELVALILAVKGSRQIDEKKCISLLRTIPDLRILVSSVEETELENQKLEDLRKDFSSWSHLVDLSR